MPKIKLPKALLANEHLLIRKRAKKSIFTIAKEERKGIADLVEEMVNNYLDDNYKDNADILQANYITQ